MRAVAYRMLGSLDEADDAVQDTWLRLSRAGASEVENLGGWLTTIVARVCLNILRARNVRREEPLGVHLPDPVIRPPEEEALLADSVGDVSRVRRYRLLTLISLANDRWSTPSSRRRAPATSTPS